MNSRITISTVFKIKQKIPYIDIQDMENVGLDIAFQNAVRYGLISYQAVHNLRSNFEFTVTGLIESLKRLIEGFEEKISRGDPDLVVNRNQNYNSLKWVKDNIFVPLVSGRHQPNPLLTRILEKLESEEYIGLVKN